MSSGQSKWVTIRSGIIASLYRKRCAHSNARAGFSTPAQLCSGRIFTRFSSDLGMPAEDARKAGTGQPEKWRPAAGKSRSGGAESAAPRQCRAAASRFGFWAPASAGACHRPATGAVLERLGSRESRKGGTWTVPMEGGHRPSAASSREPARVATACRASCSAACSPLPSGSPARWRSSPARPTRRRSGYCRAGPVPSAPTR